MRTYLRICHMQGLLRGAMAVVLVIQAVAFGEISLELKVSKKEYICGEPVIFKTIMRNEGPDSYEGSSNFGWGSRFGFTMYIAQKGEEFRDLFGFKQQGRYQVTKPPLQFDHFRDRHRLAKSLSPGQQRERTDLLVFPDAGEYMVRAMIREDDFIVYESLPVEFRVVELSEKSDSISRLVDQDLAISLGYSVFYAHFAQELMGGYGPTQVKSLSDADFERLAPQVIKRCRGSVFREYVMYADILTHYRPETNAHELLDGRKELAEQFEREYPDSWLLCEIYRKLFFTYKAEGDLQNAGRIQAKALKETPDATVLRYVFAENNRIPYDGPLDLHTSEETRGWSRLLWTCAIIGSVVVCGVVLLGMKSRRPAE